MEGICKCSSSIIVLGWFGFTLSSIQWFVDSGNLSKLTGHMPVVKERIHQVSSEIIIRYICFEQIILVNILYNMFLWICRSLQHICWWPQPWGYRCYTFRILFCLPKLFVSFILLWFLSKNSIHFIYLELEQSSFIQNLKKCVCASIYVIMVHCILNNFVGDLAWLTNFIFLMVLEMQELCGIRRLVVQGDLDLFHSVANRSIFVLKS